MLHGSGPGTTGAGAWAATAAALAGSHRVVAPDQAGFGSTPLPPGTSGGLRAWTDQAAGLMDALGETSYAVVGHSMGGAVALALAAARPRQVTRVVAVATMGAPGAPLSADLNAVWAAAPGRAGARDMLGRLVLDQSLVTEEAVAARADAMEAGAESFAVMFPRAPHPVGRRPDPVRHHPVRRARTGAAGPRGAGPADAAADSRAAAPRPPRRRTTPRPRPLWSRAAAGAAVGVPGAPGGLPRRRRSEVSIRG